MRVALRGSGCWRTSSDALQLAGITTLRGICLHGVSGALPDGTFGIRPSCMIELRVLSGRGDERRANYCFVELNRGVGNESKTRCESSANRLFAMGAGRAIIVMGVTGAGKSTIGELLAAELRCEFLDADNFHSAENKAKMKRGVPLTDKDRMPWLETLRDLLVEHVLRGQSVVLACSALLPKYRDLLRTADYEFLPEAPAATTATPEAVCKLNEDSPPTTSNEHEHNPAGREGRDLSSRVVFVYLNCTADVLAARVTAREMAGTHYMPASLLQSQIDALKLERDERDILPTDASLAPPIIVEHIRKELVV